MVPTLKFSIKKREKKNEPQRHCEASCKEKEHKEEKENNYKDLENLYL
jgi:hypothetical protein